MTPADFPPTETILRRPTMRDIARAAGCSQTTVSFVLNRKAGVKISPATRLRVIETARTLGYDVTPADARIGRRAASLLETPLARGTQTEKVVHELGLAIASNRFPEDSVLPRDAELMAHFGVSRTVLREALKILSGKRLVHSKARIGTRVRHRSEWSLFDPDLLKWQMRTGLDANFAAYVGEIRWALEPEAAALACARRTTADVELLYRLVDKMGAPGVTQQRFVEADLAIHVAIAHAAANPFLAAISALIEVALTAALTKSWPGDEPGGIVRSAARHRAIVDAIKVRDGEAARAAMRVVVAEGRSKLEVWS